MLHHSSSSSNRIAMPVSVCRLILPLMCSTSLLDFPGTITAISQCVPTGSLSFVSASKPVMLIFFNIITMFLTKFPVLMITRALKWILIRSRRSLFCPCFSIQLPLFNHPCVIRKLKNMFFPAFYRLPDNFPIRTESFSLPAPTFGNRS